MDSEFEDWVELPEPAAAAIVPPAPQVPLTRRRSRRWIFLPPFLLCLSACGVLAYRVWTPDWQGLSTLITRSFRRPASLASKRLARVEASPVMTELAASSPRDPALLPASALNDSSLRRLSSDLSSSEGPTQRDRVARPEAVPGLPTGDLDLLAAARPDREMKRAWDDIVRETETKKAERETFEALRPAVEVRQALEQDTGELRRLDRNRQETESDRISFREDLRQAVERFGSKAGPAIRVITQKHVVEASPDVERNMERALKNAAGRLDWASRIHLRRAHGLPEALILEVLAEDEMRNTRARNGPRNEDEALVRAAKQLLNVPIAPPPRPSNSPNPPGRRRPVSAR
jgi:hypothetical protein